MSRLPGESVAVPGAARGGIGHAAAGHDHRVRGVALRQALGPGDAPVLDEQRLRAVAHQPDAPAAQLLFQRAANIKGAVAHGVHPLAPLHLQRYAQRLEECHGIAPLPAGKGAVKESSITRHMGDQLVTLAVVGHVAAALARDVKLFAQPLVGLEQRYRRAPAGGADRRHHTGGSAADHQYISHPPPSRKSRTAPTPAPAP